MEKNDSHVLHSFLGLNLCYCSLLLNLLLPLCTTILAAALWPILEEEEEEETVLEEQSVALA